MKLCSSVGLVCCFGPATHAIEDGRLCLPEDDDYDDGDVHMAEFRTKLLVESMESEIRCDFKDRG